MSDHQPAQRQILYGLLALQNGFLENQDLIAALGAWSADRARPMRDVLTEQGKLDPEAAALLEALVDRYVTLHGGSTVSSLAALADRVPARVLDEMGDVSDPALEKTVTYLYGSKHEATPSMTPTEPDGDPEATVALNGTAFRRPASAAGRFRRIRHLADDNGAYGHMGLIWIAEDTELHREVALKEILDRQADSPAARARFVREAELGGGLEHPGVVPIYSLGAGPDGRPHFAMRLIRGESFRQAIRRHHDSDQGPADPAARKLEFRGLLRRLIDACNAIAYAHDRGVIHRDIKPANIMLGTYGETMVIDWGLARTIDRPDSIAREAGGLLRPPSTSGTDYRDETGQIIGTPSYIPPEAISGQPENPTPAGDIYSLGVTLYVLLTGNSPFNGTVKSVLDQVRSARFPRPSEANREVPRALEAICLKAMSHRPSDRYATARDLAREIERWLGDEPVLADREPLTARVARWARRHQPLVAGAGALLITAAVALGIGLWRVDQEKQRTAAQALRAQRGEQQASQNALRADAHYRTARTLAFDVLALSEDNADGLARIPGTEAARARMVRAARKPFDSFLRDHPTDPTLRYQAARLRIFEANIERTRNQLDQADEHYDQATHLLEGLITEAPEDAAYRDRLSEALRDRSQLLERRGKLAEAAEVLLRAHRFIEPIRAKAPDDPAFARTSATVLFDLAGAQSRRGKHEEALELAVPAVALLRTLVAHPNPAQPNDPLLLVLAMEKQAIALRELDRPDEALAVHDEAIALARAEAESPRADSNDHNILGRAILERCRTLARRPDDRGAAEADLAPAIDGWERLVRDYADIPSYRAWLGDARTTRAALRIELGRLDQAEADLAAAREGLAALVEEFPDVPGYRGNLGITIATQGRLALARNDAPGAARHLDEAIGLLAQVVRDTPEHQAFRQAEARARTDRDNLPAAPPESQP